MTIPMMKRVGNPRRACGGHRGRGFERRPDHAAGDGFAVFFMIVLLDVAYADIIVAALIPALLYFLTSALPSG